MVPWYTVKPPANGLCPKHCKCTQNSIDHDIQSCLEGYYERHILRIMEQAKCTKATKEYLLQYAAAPYWEGKADSDQLKISYHLMDLSAPLRPCMTPIVKR
jgi:hypothetical protein